MKLFVFWMWTILEQRNLKLWPLIIFPRIMIWPQFAHINLAIYIMQSQICIILTTKISVSYRTFSNKWLQIKNLNIKWYKFEISQKGTIGNLYRIVSTRLSQLSWTRTVKFSKNWYDNYQYRYCNYKNWYNNFWSQDHLCLWSRPCLVSDTFLTFNLYQYQ